MVFSKVKVATFEGDLEKLAKDYSELSCMHKNNKECLWMTQEKNLLRFSLTDPFHPEFNLTISVTGADEKSVYNKMKDLEENLGVDMRDAPDYLVEIYEVHKNTIKNIFY